jgi:hypothetical protein
VAVRKDHFLRAILPNSSHNNPDFNVMGGVVTQFLLSTVSLSGHLPEQCRIVAQLDALQSQEDALKRLQSETAAELDAFLPAILDRAFKGEL